MRDYTVYMVPVVVGATILAVAYRNLPRPQDRQSAAPVAAPRAAVVGSPSSFLPVTPSAKPRLAAAPPRADTGSASRPSVRFEMPQQVQGPPAEQGEPLLQGGVPPSQDMMDARLEEMQQRYDGMLADQQRRYEARLEEQRRQFEQELVRDRQRASELESLRQRGQEDQDRRQREQAERDRQRQEQAERDRRREEERNRMVYYECSWCKATITRRNSESAPASWDGGACQSNSTHRHSWSRR